MTDIGNLQKNHSGRQSFSRLPDRMAVSQQFALLVSSAAGGLILVTWGTRLVAELPANIAVWLTASILLSFFLCGWWISRSREENPWIAPTYLLMALFFYRYGWGALVAYYWSALPWIAYPRLRTTFFGHGIWWHLSPACLLVLLSGCGLLVGLNLPRHHLSLLLPSINWPVDHRKLKRLCVICAPIVLLIYWLVHSHLPTGLEALAFMIVSISNGLMILGSYYLFRYPPAERLKWVLFVAMVYLCTLPTALSTGQMEPLLMPALMIVCGYVLARRSLPWIRIILALPLALYFVLPFTAFYKFAGVEGTIDKRLWQAREAFAKSTYEARLELSLSRTVVRFCGMPFPATFLQYYPTAYPYELGRSFLIELSGLVPLPRVIWPQKPQVSPELNRYSEAVGLVARDSGTSAVFDLVSEYYVNFGAAGVFIFSIVHGWYFSSLYEWLVRRGNYLIGGAIYLSLVFSNVDFFGVFNVFSTHVRILLLWLPIYYMMSRRTYGPG